MHAHMLFVSLIYFAKWAMFNVPKRGWDSADLPGSADNIQQACWAHTLSASMMPWIYLAKQSPAQMVMKQPQMLWGK